MPGEQTTSQNMHAALVQLLESWQRAGVSEIGTPTPDEIAPLVAHLQTIATQQPTKQATAQTIPIKTAAPRPAAAIAPTSPALPKYSPPTKPIATQATPSISPAMPRTPKQPAPVIFETSSPTEGALQSLVASPATPADARPMALQIIRDEVKGCVRCTELATTRTNTVFGVGDPNAQLCFVGEAPGADEDAKGEPFVGRAGQLLTKIIEACQLTRETVYIANVLKCRPPNNRPPEPYEVVNCRGYLDRQLEIIRPQVIVCLGATAAKCLLNTEVSIGKLRGRWHDYRGLQVYCTYHPAYLLRNPNAKKDVWEDMKVVMKRLGVDL